MTTVPSPSTAQSMLDAILATDPPPFAILFRPLSAGHLPSAGSGPLPDAELMIGDVTELARIADLPAGDPHGPPVLAVVPFRQIAERGFDVVDDGVPLLALTVRQRARISLADLLDRLPADAGPFHETGYDVPDDAYEATVRAVLDGEIAAGEGSNFVIHRALTAHVELPAARAALGALRRLLTGEQQSYWTFVVHTPQRTFVGATPERHVSLDAGIARMNPISGTLRHPAGGWAGSRERQDAVLAFLADPKERDELSMVLDEELKMMAQVGDLGGRVAGPYLKEMAHLAHTEYVLAGRTSLDARQVLAATLFAPTVTGSPIRNACRVIARHERRGRGYYGGVLALFDHDDDGRQRMDAPILIRTAHLSPDGTVAIPAGATLVRGSRPDAELAETRSKAAAILSAFRSAPATAPTPDEAARPDQAALAVSASLGSLNGDPRVAQALARRNDTLAAFWLHERPVPRPGATPITVVDAEDDFTAMLAHQLRSLGLGVRVLPWTAGADVALDPGLLVLGPGPGDPADRGDPRIDVLHRIARQRLTGRLPTLGICLGHQILGLELGLRVRRLPVPDQGVQREVRLRGHRRRVGFYNSYALAPPEPDRPVADVVVDELVVDADPSGQRIVAMRGPGFAGLQFHPESVLTMDGVEILESELAALTPVARVIP